MTYFDRYCICKETYPPHCYEFTGKCITCKQTVMVKVPGSELFQYRQGKIIQDAMPSVNDADREFLMSGICGKCFDEMFKDEE